MKNLLTKIIILLVILTFSISYTSCNKKSKKEVIKIGVLEGPSAISLIPIIDKSHMIDGKDVEVIIKKEPFQLQAMMMKNELDFAVIPTVMAANLYNKGVKYQMVACPIWGTLYIVANNENIKYYEDLEGKEISVFGHGTTADLLLQHNLHQRSINYKNIDYRFTTNEELAQALLAKEVEVAVLSEPLVSIMISENDDLHIIDQLCVEKYTDSPEKNIFVQSAFLVSENFVKNNSYLISEISDAYVASCNFVNENTEEAAEMLVHNGYAKNKKNAIQSIELCNIQYVSAFAIQKELYSYLQIFHDMDPATIGGKYPKPDFIYNVYK